MTRGPGDGETLLHRTIDQRPDLGFFAHHPHGASGERAEPRPRADEQQLLPELDPDGGRGRGVDARGREHLEQPADPFRIRTVQLAERHEDVRSEVMDDPGRFDLAEHLGESAEHPFGSDHGRQLVGRLDTVQERQHHGVRAEQRPRRRRDFRYLPRLHRHHHEVDRADIGRIVGCRGVGQVHVTQGTGYPQAAVANGLQVRAAGDERHVVAGAGEPCTVVSAEPAGTVDCDFQRWLLLYGFMGDCALAPTSCPPQSIALSRGWMK